MKGGVCLYSCVFSGWAYSTGTNKYEEVHMRKRSYNSLIAILASIMILAGCSGGAKPSEGSNAAPADNTAASNEAASNEAPANTTDNAAAENTSAEEDAPKKDVSGEITVWAFTDKVFQE